MAILHGRNLIIKVDGTAVAAAKSCEINVDAETIEIASPTTGAWRQYIAGRKSWGVSVGYLVKAPGIDIPKVGTEVQLSIDPSPSAENMVSFDGFVAIGTVLQQSVSRYDAIVFHTSTNTFVAKVNGLQPKYYANWLNRADAFINPEGYFFVYNGTVYIFNGTTLVEYTGSILEGAAIVRRCKISGTVGSLSQGSFEYQGNGPLAPPTTSE